jgi:fibronectin type 3 domain-containing protein
LSWTANAEPDLAGYDLYRSTSSPVDTSGTPLNGGDLLQGATYSDTAVSNGTTYYYALVAVDSADNRSTASAEASAAPQVGDPVFVGAGDIADCTSSGDEATATLLDNTPGAVYTIGDNVYPNGLLSEYTSCYDPSWGRPGIKSRTRPVVGNHDYGNGSNNGDGYFDYFNGVGNFTGPAGDRDKAYYSYDIGNYWHIVALNTECGIDASCSLTTEEQWLRGDLAANASKNVIALWHRPRWSSGPTRPGDSRFQGLWQDLYNYGVELLLVGHDHQYERFAPQNAGGQLDTPHGVREIIVGTGGAALSSVGAPVANSQVLNNTTWGVLKLTLHQSSFDWRFIPVAGNTFTDSGTDQVHGAPTNTPPSATVSLNSSTPLTNDTLTATATKTDAEGQAVSLTYVWKVNGVSKRTTTTTSLTDSFNLGTAGNGDKGDSVIVEVTPNDGLVDGTTVSAGATVANSDPVFNQNLGDRTDGENASVSLSAAATDADSDPLTYEVTGLPPGLTINAQTGLISGTIAFGAAASSPYPVSVTVRDGTAVDATDTFTWTVTPTNRPPVLDSVTIDQTAPKTNDTLTVTVQSHDPDGDTVGYAYQWKKNGTNIAGATGASLDLSVAGNGDKNDAISVTVTGSDGNANSTPVTAAAVTVANSPPTATVSLNNQQPASNDTLQATATKHDDDAADAVSLTFTWEVNGVTRRTTTTATALSDSFDLSVAGNGDPGDTITVQVTPSDGVATGTAVSDNAVVQADTNPPAMPANLAASVTSRVVNLDWNDNTEADFAGYNVYRGTPPDVPTKLNSVPLTTSSYQDTTAAADTSYSYFVSAVDTSNNESQRAAVQVDRGIVYRSSSTGQANGATSLTVTKPTGVATGDVLLASISVLGQATITPPIGWTLVSTITASTTLREATYIHVVGSSETSSYRWTFSAAQNASGTIIAYVGVDNTAPVDVSSGAPNASSTNATAPALTTTNSNELLLASFGVAANATVTPPVGMLEQAEILGGGGNSRVVTETSDQEIALAGSTGSRTATLTKAGVNIGQLVALRPGSAPSPLTTVPGAPQSLAATPGNATVHLSWAPPTTDGGTPITAYNLYRGTASGAETLLSSLGTVTSYDDNAVSNGTQYFYVVRAVNAVGEGTASNEVTATPATAPATLPTAPLNLAAVAAKGKGISLSWSPPASNGGASITSYVIYRGTTPGSESRLTSVGNVTSYKDTSVTRGATYYYKVAAVNSAGEGPQSSEASATAR